MIAANGIARPWRFFFTSLLLGPLWALGFWVLPWTRTIISDAWMYGIPARTPAVLALLLSVTAVTTSTIWRRKIVRARGWKSLAISIQALATAAAVFLWICWLCDGLWDLLRRGSRPVEMSDADWAELLGGLFVAPLLGLWFAFLCAPVGFPLSWLSVLVLRWAGGAPAREPVVNAS